MRVLTRIRNYILLCLFLALFALCGILFYNGWEQSDLIMNPPRTEVTDKERDVATHPSDYGLELHPFTVALANGTEFRACFIKAASGDDTALAVRQNRMKKLLAERKQISSALPSGMKRGTIVLSHGRGEDMEDMYRVAEYFTAADFDCISYDYGPTETGETKSVLTGSWKRRNCRP